MNAVKEKTGMTLIVKTVTRITFGFILLYGIYIALNGDTASGGGFVGGVIIALSLVHIMLAFGKEDALKRLHSYSMRFAVSIASLAFLYMVMKGPRGSCSHIAMSFTEMIIVGAGLFAIFVALTLLQKKDKDSE
ncbi:MAG: MnhB domain-containing protein [Candidatus Omnitrophota bacterium]|nr:MnhB domain-containing protein [Candidatus Omnitrophota bacterium]